MGAVVKHGGDAVLVPALAAFDEARARELLRRSDSLSTFDDVNAWDSAAEAEVAKIRAYLAKLDDFERSLGEIEQRARTLRAQRPLLKRVFARAPWKRDARARRNFMKAARLKLPDLVDELQALIDKTPNSREEQQEMLKELRLVKKELNAEKRQVNEAMRQIRTDARQQGAKVGSGLGLFLSTSTSRRLDRMSIRLGKEAALSPHEDAKGALERQLLVVERALLWVERFK